MAREPDSLADMLSCGVCFNEYGENCATIPRLFPCSHTLCESCIKELIINDTLVCPMCRKKHRAKGKEKAFPQNEYLLVQIRKNKEEAQSKDKDDAQSKEKCKLHGKELVLYCVEKMCQKAVCISCLVDHKKHEVIDIEEHEKEVLTRKLWKIQTNLEVKVQMISDAKNDVTDKTSTCVRELKKLGEEIEKMVQEAEAQKTKTIEKADEELVAVHANIELLKNIIDNQDAGNHVKDSDTIRAIIDHTKKNLSGARSFKFPVFNAPTERNLVRITTGEHSVLLPDYQDTETDGATTKQLLPKRITNAAELKCTGKCITFSFVLFVLNFVC